MNLGTLKTAGAFVLLGTVAAGCGKKSSSGGGIGAPLAYPPTAAVTPSALVALSGASSLFASLAFQMPTANSSSRTSTVLDLIKERLFSSSTAGPTDLLRLIKNVDTRMSDLDAQFSGQPSWLSGTAVDYSTTFTVPATSGTAGLPLKAQCKTTYSTTGLVLVGNDGNDWYLLDGDTGSGAMTVNKVSGTSDADRIVDGYMIVLPQDASARESGFNGSTALIHYRADNTAGTMEFTAGGVNIGFDQAHAKSNATYFYIEVERGGTPSTPATLETGCFDKSTLAEVTPTSTCTAQTDLAFSVPTLGANGVGTTSMGTVPTTTAANVNLPTLNAGFITKLSTEFSSVPTLE